MDSDERHIHYELFKPALIILCDELYRPDIIYTHLTATHSAVFTVKTETAAFNLTQNMRIIIVSYNFVCVSLPNLKSRET